MGVFFSRHLDVVPHHFSDQLAEYDCQLFDPCSAPGGREDGNAKLARLRSLQIVVNKLSEELCLWGHSLSRFLNGSTPLPLTTGIQLDARSPD
ncbi:hypothetical protein Peur_054817 [Populus x canadensis]